MSEYHPIDVRYKGPSTAYRGSGAVGIASALSPTPAALPKVQRKPRRRSVGSTFGPSHIPLRLLFWVLKKGGGVVIAIILYFALAGFELFNVMTAVNTF